MTTRPDAASTGIVQLVADLLAQLDGTAVTECEFRTGDHHIRVRRSPSFPRLAATAEAESEEVPSLWRPILSPLTGIFYAAENPQSPPFASVGDMVNIGQTMGLIEAMKTFNRVESELAGIVRAILVANGAEVQVGQTLLYVEPLGDAA
jgi:biotin carboxyl carrier protein